MTHFHQHTHTQTHTHTDTDDEAVKVWEVEMDDGIQTVYRGPVTR